MTHYELAFAHGAHKEFAELDGSVRPMVLKGLARLRVRPTEIGKPLSGDLAGCRELKFRANGIRVVYRVREGEAGTVDILAIGARDKSAAFKEAEHRLEE